MICQAVAAWKAQIAKHPSSIESLESALAMEPEDAWDRFLSQKDLQDSNDQAETPDQPEPDQAQETESDASEEESLGGDLATFIKKAVDPWLGTSSSESSNPGGNWLSLTLQMPICASSFEFFMI